MDPPAPFGLGASRRVKPTVRVGVGVVVLGASSSSGNGKIYAGRRRGSHGASKLALPGGHLEVNESWEDCAVREVEEEMGITVETKDVKFLHVTNDIMLDEGEHYVTIFMVCKLSDGSAEPENREPQKCEGWEAFSVEELTAMVGQDELFGPLENLLTEMPAKLAALFKNLFQV